MARTLERPSATSILETFEAELAQLRGKGLVAFDAVYKAAMDRRAELVEQRAKLETEHGQLTQRLQADLEGAEGAALDSSERERIRVRLASIEPEKAHLLHAIGKLDERSAPDRQRALANRAAAWRKLHGAAVREFYSRLQFVAAANRTLRLIESGGVDALREPGVGSISAALAVTPLVSWAEFAPNGSGSSRLEGWIRYVRQEMNLQLE